MKIEREILGIDVTIDFDDCGNIWDIEVDKKDIDTLQQNAIDIHIQSSELVREYMEHLYEQAQDREFERRRGN